MNNSNWYALFVQTGYEDEICKMIDCLTQIFNFSNKTIYYETLVPKRKLYETKHGITNQVIRKLFPGYILIKTDDIEYMYIISKKCFHSYRFIRRANYSFSIIKQDEILQILKLMDGNGVIDVSNVFIENDKVRILSGPLFNYTGIVKKINKSKKRAKIEIQIMGKNLPIDVSIYVLDKLPNDDINKIILFKKTIEEYK
ncbi:antiterminator LoaP [Clostridium estertheticum]|uniref:antiterminator LoaP n=1 Tax=Clostridium estertheticum TaxID=238834 RepID=UPI0013EE61FD|nr:antiterminator LoaP [Clostridium estertheticum]MBZ9609897.1 antiterminator LoaP [Clostridium estertheticum]